MIVEVKTRTMEIVIRVLSRKRTL